MHAFVTGATGFVGLNLVERLSALGWEVTAFHRPGSNLGYLGRLAARRATGTIEDYDSVVRAIPEGVDAVFHAAASLTWWRPAYRAQEEANVGGARNVVRAALARRAKRFVHTSSITAYGLQPSLITEATASSAEKSPVGYFRTKYLAEEVVRAAVAQGLSAIILNPVNIIGPYDDRQWGRTFLTMDRNELMGVPPGRAEFCHVRAVVDAHIAALTRGAPGESFILGGVTASYLEVIQIIARLLGCKVPRKTMPPALLRIGAHTLHLGSLVTRKEPLLTPDKLTYLCHPFACSSAKAQQVLGYPQSQSLQGMLEDAHRWLAAEGLVGGRAR